MPVEKVTAEEWERLTGSRGSVYIGPAPVRRPKPSQESETMPTQSGPEPTESEEK
jgi:hypothetical protein